MAEDMRPPAHDGGCFLQLQYTRTILHFIGLKWPDDSLATLVKQ